MGTAWSVMLLCFTIVFCGIQKVTPARIVTSQQSLLKRATRVTDSNDWAADTNVIAYYWLSNTYILFIRADSGGECTLRQYNTVTKVEKPIPGPDSHLIEMEAPPIVSPDGKWMMTFTSGPSFGVSSLTGSHSGGGGVDLKGAVVGWFNDSRHWGELKDVRLLIHNVYAPTQAETIRIPRTSPLLRKDTDVRCLSRSLFLAHTDLVHNVETIHGLPKVDVFAVKLTADARHTWHYTYHAPVGYRIFDAVFSPDGTYVAWLLQSPRTGRVSLRVSRLNLTGMHELGTLEDTPMGNQGPHLAARYSLRWLPNGKHLSFLYQRMLWTVRIYADFRSRLHSGRK